LLDVSLERSGVQIPVAWSPRATGILYGGD